MQKISLRLLIPLAVFLLLLWLHQGLPQTPRTTTTDRSQSKEEKTKAAESRHDSSAQASSRALSSRATSLWTMASNPEGSANGLRPAFAATSRGRNELPEGRRWKLENFPDLRELKEGQQVVVQLPDGREFMGAVVYSRRDDGYKDRHLVTINFDDNRGTLFATDDAVDNRRAGRLLVTGDNKAWTFAAGRHEEVWLREHWREDLICELRSLPVAALRSDVLPGDPTVFGPGVYAPVLNSRPLASGVLFIDFDGEPATIYPDWGACVSTAPVAVPHSGLNASQMTYIWRRVAEDFSPFNINVTTSEEVYDAAPVGKRMRMLIGATLPECVRGAGVAQMNSFRNTGSSRVPCWMSTDAYGGSSISVENMSAMASNISHEFGHAMGLWHDGMLTPQPSDADPGSSYYPGHGSLPLDWSPIMGGPYRPVVGGAREVIQWAKDEYPGANNAQDDIAILAGPENGVGFAPDESTAFANAPLLTPLDSGRVGATGVISSESDFDYWQFTIDFSGDGTVEMAPADLGLSCANLDCAFYIADSTLTNFTGPYGGDNNLEASVTRYFTPGTYYILAFSQGNLQASDGTGYSAYGSNGRYVVTVVPPVDGIAPTVTIASPAQNTLLTGGSIDFHGTASDNNAISNVELFLRRDADSSYWNGSYWQIGRSGAALNNYYNPTTQTWTCTSSLPQAGAGVSSLSPGTYTFTARAYDLGALNTEVTSVASVDAIGPTVTIDAPVSGSLLGTPGLNFTGTAEENGTLQYVVGYIRRNADGQYWNGSAWQSGSTGAYLSCDVVQRPATTIYDWNCTATLPSLGSTLTPGSYAFIAIAVDGVGLLQQRDAVVDVDSTPPVTTLIAPAHESLITSGPVPFHGTITDNAGVWRVVCFIRRQADYLYWDGSAWIVDPGAANLSTTYNAGDGTWSCNAALPVPGGSLQNGVYNFIALGFDHAGNVHQKDSVVTVDFHQTYVWNGSSGGAWEDAASWTPNGIPGADDYVLLNNGGTVTNNANRSVYGFRVVNGTMTSSVGNSLTFTNDSAWTGGRIGGIWNNAAGATTEFNNSSLLAANPGTILNNYGLILNKAGNVTLQYFLQQQAGGVIRNSGSNVYLSGGGDYVTGSVLDAAIGTITLNGGTHTFYGGSLVGLGITYSSAGTMNIQGNVGTASGSATGRFGMAGGTLNGSAQLSVSDVIFQHGLITGAVSLRMTGVSSKSASETLSMNGGTIRNEGSFTMASNSHINLDSVDGGGAGVFRNEEDFFTTGGTISNTYGAGVFQNNGLVRNDSGNQSYLCAFENLGNGRLRNQGGTIYLSGGGQQLAGSVLDAASGSIYLNGGTHTFYGGSFEGASTTICSSGTMNVQGNVGATSGTATGGFGIAGGTVTGTGMVSAERGYFSSGTLGGAVVLRFTSGFTKAPSTTLNMNGGTIQSDGLYDTPGGTDFNLDSDVSAGAGTIFNKGTWRLNNASNYSNTYGAGQFVNEGLFDSMFGASNIYSSFESMSGSTVRVNGGVLRLYGGGIQHPGTTLHNNGGDIYFSGGTHQLQGGTIIGSGHVYATGGTVSVEGNVGAATGVATGGFGISGGTVTGSAIISADHGSFYTGTMGGSVTLRYTGNSTKSSYSNLDMNGGTILNEGEFTNQQGGSINLDSVDGGSAGTIHNKGTWRFVEAFAYSNTYGGGVFRNEGLVESMAGISIIHSAFLSEAGSTFRANSGYVRLHGGGIHQAGSTFDSNGGDIYFSAGSHQLLGGTLTGDGYLYATGGTVTASGNVGASSGAATGGFGISGGTVTGSAMISADHGNIYTGTMEGSVTLRYTGDSTKSSNTNLDMNGGTILNEGEFTNQQGGSINLDSVDGGSAGTIHNKGTWRFIHAFTYSNTNGGGVFRNEGLVESMAGVSIIHSAFLSEAGSTFRSNSGYVRLHGGGIHQAGSTFDSDGGDIYFSAGSHQLLGGTLTGEGYLYATGGTVTASGNVGASSGTATGGFGISGGTVTGSAMISSDHGSFYTGMIEGTVTLRYTGDSTKGIGTNLDMNGGTIRNEGIMTQQTGGTFNLDSSVSEGAGVLENIGTWNQIGASNINNTYFGGSIENYGLWQVSAGSSSNQAYFTHRADSIFRISGGQMIFFGGSTMKSGSTIDVSGGDLYLNGGTHTLEGGTITGSQFVFSGGGSTVVTGDVGATSGAATGGFGVYSLGSVSGTAMISAEHGYLGAGSIGGSVTLRYTGDSTKGIGTNLDMNGGTIRNEGTMSQQTSGTFNLDSSATEGAGVLENIGTWNQIGASNINNTYLGGSIENYGLWHVSAGSSSNQAYFTHRADSIFRVSDGQMIFFGGSTMKAGSTIDVSGGDLYLNGGTHTLEGGTITGSQFVFSGGGSTVVTGDVGATSGPATGGFGVYSLGSVSGTAMISAEHGYLAAGSIGGSVTLRFTGDSTKGIGTNLDMNGGTIRNEGTMSQQTSGDFNLDSGSGGGAGSIINSGTWTINGSCNFNNSYLNGTLQNEGTFEVMAGTTNMYGHFTNSGFTRVVGASLYLRAGSVHTGSLIANGSVIFVGSGHSFTGPNAILGGSGYVGGMVTLANAARIAPGNSPGTLTLNGSVEFLSSVEAPAIAIELAAASQFDQIALSNGASLSLGTGVTDLLLDLQYQPTPGQSFRIVSAGTSTGTFSGRFRNAATSGAMISATYQGNPYQFRVNYDVSNKYIDLVYQSGYQSWIATYNLTGNDALFDADPDGDGVPNGIEFLMGRDPRPGFPDPIHPGENIPLVDETHLRFVYRRVAAARYLPTVVQYNSNLGPSWNQASAGVNGVTITNAMDFYGPGIDQVETRIPRSLALDGRMFLRLISSE